ncbi:MAG: Ppx/GppA family phosphatase [Nitrospirae bacterium]|nr:Ppx/GppA family phosphatase [Nitrospirota bacterium]
MRQSPTNKKDSQDRDLYAAADLGSNSFHMIVARYSEGRFHVIDRVRDVVRLAEGIDKTNSVSPETMLRALAALQQFSLCLGNVPPSNIRVVGTSALRNLKDKSSFITAAREILGLPIDIISGEEEARLINLGVAGNMKDLGVARLIIDIGGGSTEIMVGKDTNVLAAESLSMGCVSFSRRFFSEEKITLRLFKHAVTSASSVLAPVMSRFSGVPWFDVVGTSGTIKATRKVIAAQEWGNKEITMSALDKVIDALTDVGQLDGLHALKGLSRDRAPVFPGGLAILKGIMQCFGLKSMRVSKAAMREGILLDLLQKKS